MEPSIDDIRYFINCAIEQGAKAFYAILQVRAPGDYYFVIEYKANGFYRRHKREMNRGDIRALFNNRAEISQNDNILDCIDNNILRIKGDWAFAEDIGDKLAAIFLDAYSANECLINII